jgi:hypothetical protein
MDTNTTKRLFKDWKRVYVPSIGEMNEVYYILYMYGTSLLMMSIGEMNAVYHILFMYGTSQLMMNMNACCSHLKVIQWYFRVLLME